MDRLIKDTFFALIQAGLWERSVQILPFEPIDFPSLFDIADQQSVVGLIAAGLEQVEDRKITKAEALPFMTKVLSLENRNESMNKAIISYVFRMRRGRISALLIKGQGVAQCYAKPLWRSSGDIDFLLDSDSYERAKILFSKDDICFGKEETHRKHLALSIDSWTVELHGTLHGGLSRKIDLLLDSIQDESLRFGKVRIWNVDETDVFLPIPDNDAIIVFTHLLKHFYKGGIGLRQVCDWCRLLWTYRNVIDRSLLEFRIRKMRLMSEWKAFAAFAVDYLGMPMDAIPMYDSARCWSLKANRICSFILKVGNFGRNRDMSYFQKYPYLVRKVCSFKRRCCDMARHALIFPLDSVRFFPNIVLNGLTSSLRGE